MNTLFKSILLSQCVILGFSHAYAGGIKADEENQGPSNAHPAARIALTMPWKPCSYNGRNTFTITLKGAQHGKHEFSLTERQILRYAERQVYFHNKEKNRYIPLDQEKLADSLEYIARYEERYRLKEYLLFPDFDLSWLEGDITISMTHTQELAGRVGLEQTVRVNPIRVQTAKGKPFTTETTSVHIMLDHLFRNAEIRVDAEDSL